MKLDSIYYSLISAALLSMSTSILADEHNDGEGGIQNAINQHDKNIDKYEVNHPDKDLPKGLVHSREVLERIHAGERPNRPERSARPDRPERVAKADRPERPSRPERSRR